MRILIVDPQFDGEPEVERAITGPDAEIIVWQTERDGPVPMAEFGLCDGLINCRSRHLVTPEIVAVMDRCKIVSQAGVGFNHIDLEACAARGIPVCNTPDYGTTEVADHAVTLAMALLRGVVAYDAKLKARAMGWHARTQASVQRVRGRRFGVVGLGRIGHATARRAKAFDMTIDFFDPYLDPGIELGLGYARAGSLQELLGRCDIVSLHTPLNAETDCLINKETVAACQPGQVLINTSRGRVCDLDAIQFGLEQGLLGAAGLDVLPIEPLDYAHPLLAAWEQNAPWLDGRLIITPHAAFYSPDGLLDMRRLAIQNIVNFLLDGRLRSCVNAHLLGSLTGQPIPVSL